MRKRWLWTLAFMFFTAFIISCLGQSPSAQNTQPPAQKQSQNARKMNIIGQIAKSTQGGYVTGRVFLS
jgi:hypothetical protein